MCLENSEFIAKPFTRMEKSLMHFTSLKSRADSDNLILSKTSGPCPSLPSSVVDSGRLSLVFSGGLLGKKCFKHFPFSFFHLLLSFPARSSFDAQKLVD